MATPTLMKQDELVVSKNTNMPQGLTELPKPNLPGPTEKYQNQNFSLKLDLTIQLK